MQRTALQLAQHSDVASANEYMYLDNRFRVTSLQPTAGGNQIPRDAVSTWLAFSGGTVPAAAVPHQSLHIPL